MKEMKPSFNHFKKMYPRCSRADIQNLVEAIRHDKYWSLKPGSKDGLYVVALSRATVASDRGFLVKATYLNQVEVTPSTSPYCRRGRIIVVVRRDRSYLGVSVLPWPVFLRFLRKSPQLPARLLLEDRMPPFIGELPDISEPKDL